ncbi:ATP-binding protein [Deltaproteobacteria bacterium TL4]
MKEETVPIDSDQSIIDHLKQALLVVNRKYQVTRCNEAASQLWTRPQNKLLGHHMLELFRNEPVIARNIEQVFKRQKDVYLVDFPFHFVVRQAKVVEITMRPIFGDNRDVKQALITISDQTQNAEFKAKEQEQAILDSMGLFMSSIAHEIKNPLSGVKGVTQLLQRDLEKAKMSTDPTHMILNELDRIERLLQKLCLYAEPLSLEFRAFNLHELLEVVLWFESNASPQQIHFKREFDPSLPNLVADHDKLHQVFLNLIKNAVEVSPPGGEITIRTRYCPKWQIAVCGLEPGPEYYLIEVEDEGPGVSMEHRERLFKPLFTTKSKGKGLGLSISYRIVLQHGGVLQYTTSPNNSSIFQVFLPRTPPQYNEEHELRELKIAKGTH